jgi:hypothetical protein
VDFATVLVEEMKKIPMQVSKWLDVPALLDVEELQALYEALPPFKIFFNGAVVERQNTQILWKDFLRVYSEYVQALKEGNLPSESICRPFFSSVWTIDDSSIMLSDTPTNQVIPRPWKPVVQLQLHRFGISAVDSKVRSMVFGQDTIFWGIQWSFPQLYMDAETREIIKLILQDINGNFAFFREFQRWMRYHTEPAVFQINGKSVATPIRIGKQCKSWIHKHPQLQEWLPRA